MKNFVKENAGFSLVELSIVVAVIGILAAIAIPTYMGIQKKAARSEAKSNLEAIALALEGYMAENNDYGRAGAFPYTGGSFGHSGNIEAFTKLGNDLEYNYIIRVTTAPAFAVSAVPLNTGRLAGDLTFSLDSNGIKEPANW